MPKKDRERSERRRAAKELQRREWARRRRRRRLRNWGIAGAVVLVATGLLAWAGLLGPQAAAFLGRKTTPPPGESVPNMGRSHIAVGTSYRSYNSNPPTSGPHWGTPAPCTIHAQPVPDEAAVHSLEHGAVWITYRDQGDADLAGRLAQIAGRDPTKILVSPRPQNDVPIAVAAWTRLLKLQTLDEEKIVTFINAYRGRGPEPGASC